MDGTTNPCYGHGGPACWGPAGQNCPDCGRSWGPTSRATTVRLMRCLSNPAPFDLDAANEDLDLSMTSLACDVQTGLNNALEKAARDGIRVTEFLVDWINVADYYTNPKRRSGNIRVEARGEQISNTNDTP